MATQAKATKVKMSIVGVRLSPKEVASIDILATNEGRSRSGMIRRIVSDALKSIDKE